MRLAKIIQFPSEPKSKEFKGKAKKIHKSSVIYLAITIFVCLLLILTVGNKLNISDTDFRPAVSIIDRFRYVWAEFVSNFVTEFSLFQQTMDFSAGSQPGQNHKSIAIFVVMMIQYFYLSRFIDRFLKGDSIPDKVLCFIGSCFLQVSLSIMCFTYSDQNWKSLMFYCYVITLAGVSAGMLISLVIAIVKNKRDAFKTVAVVEHKKKHYAIIGLKIIFNPFIRGFYAAVLGFCTITFIYGTVTYIMLHITSDHNIIAFILLPLSFALNKLSEFVSKKILVWKGENPDKMTAVDKVYLPIAIFLIVFWCLTVVMNISFPEYWDWMYDNFDIMKMFGNTEYYKSLY